MYTKICFMALEYGNLALEEFWKYCLRSLYEPCAIFL